MPILSSIPKAHVTSLQVPVVSHSFIAGMEMPHVGGDVLRGDMIFACRLGRVSQVTWIYGGVQREFSSCWSGAGIILIMGRERKTQKEMPCKSRMALRQKPVICIRSDWFHVRFLNSLSVWRRHWGSVEGCTSHRAAGSQAVHVTAERYPSVGPHPAWWQS